MSNLPPCPALRLALRPRVQAGEQPRPALDGTPRLVLGCGCWNGGLKEGNSPRSGSRAPSWELQRPNILLGIMLLTILSLHI